MKRFLFFAFTLFSFTGFSQYITVDSNSYTPQELIEDILINSGCIENILVTSSVSGSFNTEKSIGYFNKNNSNFPFEDGVVMSTGRLSNVPGPNNNLSDDDANGWGADQDLEQVLGISNTLNATSIEFDFTPNANTIQFQYIFASEEYQEGDDSTCQYSDVFGFLIKPIGGTYTNIAVVPGTTTPVKVTTVHPEIPGGCDAENEQYFSSFNNNNHSINFNGQTKPLVAQASVNAGSTYHIKLVIADDYNYRYDSAVFLEGSSFNIGAHLGDDLTGENALCENETHTLSVSDNGNTPTNYEWFLVNNDNSETLLTSGTTTTDYTINTAGTYKVVVTYGANCTAEDNIEVEYFSFSNLVDGFLYECDTNNDGLSIFNLNNASQDLINNNPNFTVTNYFLTETEALSNQNPISNADSFSNTNPSQKIYARVVSISGCVTTVGLTLETTYTSYTAISLVNCYSITNSFIPFNLANAYSLIETETGLSSFSVTYYANEGDALAETNSLSNNIEVSIEDLPLSVFGKIENSAGCQGIIEVVLQGIQEPELNSNYQAPYLCVEENNTVTIEAGLKESNSTFTFEWNTGETTPSIKVDSLGTYQVNITKTEVVNGEEYTCSTTNSIEVFGSEKASISYKIEGTFDDYTLIISAEGNGDYIYSLDNQFNNYQESPIFSVEAGSHIIYVKDINGCGIAMKEIIVLGYPKFFTPNQDGINDTWRLIGTNNLNKQIKAVYIFDRFGKLLKSISSVGYWDGTFHGKQMPSSEYWFLVTFKDAEDFKGHFTLKR